MDLCRATLIETVGQTLYVRRRAQAAHPVAHLRPRPLETALHPVHTIQSSCGPPSLLQPCVAGQHVSSAAASRVSACSTSMLLQLCVAAQHMAHAVGRKPIANTVPCFCCPQPDWAALTQLQLRLHLASTDRAGRHPCMVSISESIAVLSVSQLLQEGTQAHHDWK